ncbi:unnamed protein product [Nesidiocoris tenuis]|uniref:C2H2-type domain-containing protein n=1 Tax=Nesidiocoris tenuis TaxID=355587 RepID=A0A6H5G9Y3_9HEMI|nr:unnamed protein product [Nesidiocoris tenuis]
MDDGYLSPPLPEDVLEQVESVRESMLLQGVDPNQLADSIQVRLAVPSYATRMVRIGCSAATLQEIASLEEYQSQSPSPRSIQPHQDIQSVLDSPLPVGLADFAYSHSQRNDTDSPLPPGQPYSSSPLPSPSFTYPTPPASQEGHSPSIAPLQSVISNGAVASPLSAAFYTSPMSSSAAVEAALSEVLPPNNYPSSPPTSPLSDSPVPSPLSLPPESTSPLPHHVFQSQMMPNSEDPLLSSSPRDFCPRKRFDFQALKLLTSGTLDFGNAGAQGVTGIVLDRNGELKLIQTSCIQPMKPCSVNTNSSNNNNATLYMNPKPKSDGNICNEVNTKLSTSPMKIPLTLRQMINGHGQSLDSLKEELEDVFFLSPSFNSRAALTGHTRLHLSSTGTRCGTPDRRNYHTSQLPGSETLEEFPCKICGKVFNKVKSRSAHMKSHRPQDGDPRRMRDSTIKIDAIESSSTNRTSPATNNSHRGN